MIVIVAYDISSDRRRARMERLLRDYGQRVNRSVFECDIEKPFYPQLRRISREIIDKQKDSVLFYPLCLACLKKSKHEGRIVPSIPEGFIYV